MSARAILSLMFAVAVLCGCTSTSKNEDDSSPAQSPAASMQALIYSAVVRQLITVDHTFGDVVSRAASPFQAVYILDGVAPRSPQLSLTPEGGPFSERLKSDIISNTADLPPVEFIATVEQRIDPDSGGLTGVHNDGVVIGLGTIEPRGDDVVHVGAGFYCGGLCGHGLTYIVNKIGARWQITDTTGPQSIS